MQFKSFLKQGSFLLFFFVFLFFLPKMSCSFADKPSSLFKSSFSLKNVFSLPKHKKTYAALHFNQLSFFRGKGESFQESNWGDHLATFGVDFNYFGDFKHWKSYVDITNFYSFVEKENYFHAKEIFSFSEWPHFYLTLGRKKYIWSFGDEFWKQGLWQPRFRWNKIKSEDQGLIGFFLDNLSLNKSFRFLVFYSPFFVPETGPAFKIKNENFVSKNPWFSSPKNSLIVTRVGEKDIHLPIHYNLLPTKKREVVFNQGVGLKMNWVGEKASFLTLSLAYKPMNQLIGAMGPPFIDLSHSSVPLKLDVAPRLTYHYLSTFEMGNIKNEKQNNHWNYWLSVSYEKPTNKSVLGHENLFQKGLLPVMNEHIFSSLYFSYNWPSYSQKNRRLYVGYAKSWQGKIRNAGELNLQSIVEEVSEHYEYKNAIRLGFIEPSLKLFKQSISSHIQLTYDFFFKGILLETNFEIPLLSHFIFNLSSSFISLLESQEEGSSFFHRYRISDYLKMGLKYIF